MKLTRFMFVLLFLQITHWSYAQCVTTATCNPTNATNPTAFIVNAGVFQVQLGTINRASGNFSEGYVDRTCTDTAFLYAGAVYPIFIKTGNSSPENVRVWLDLNNNGTFDLPTELIFSSNNKKEHTGTITLPPTAVLNTFLRMRVAADVALGSPVPTPCYSPDFSQAEDYGIKIGVATTAPIAAFFSPDTITCNGIARFFDQSVNVPLNWKWYFGDGDSSNLQNPQHIYSQSGNYTVKLKVSNPFGTDSITKVAYIRYNDTLPSPINCEPITLSACCGYGIFNVNFVNINQSSLGGNNSYENFTCSQRTTVIAGLSYPISITTGATENQDTRVWIDFNNDSTFSEDELVLQRLNQKNASGMIQIPIGAVQGKALRMRVASDFVGNNFGACTNLTHGQAEDYTVVVKPNTLPPSANFSYDSLNACGLIKQFINLTQNNIDSVLWDFGDSTTSTEINPTHIYLTPNTYQVRLIAYNAFGTDTIVKTVKNIIAPLPSSCIASTGSSSCCGIGIVRLRFGNIDKTSGSAVQDGGYRDFTCTDYTVVEAGQTYPITINCGVFFNTENVRVWIDYNHNGILEPTAELVFSSNNSQVHTGNITIPQNVARGVSLRMRVISEFAAVGGAILPCANLAFGQAEDYTVYVSPTSPVADFTASPTNACTFKVAFTDLSLNTPNAWLWNFGDGTTSTQKSPTHTYAAAGTYTVSLKVSNESGSDSITKIDYITVNPTNILPNAACMPATLLSCCGTGVHSVELNNNIHTSLAADQEGFRDFTCSIDTFQVNAGLTYPITIKTGNTLNENVRVWIDYNNNGIFDSNELVISSNNQLNTHTQNITIPVSAANRVVRMRVKSSSELTNINNPCAEIVNGQVEDYRLIIGDIATSLDRYSDENWSFYPNPAQEKIIIGLPHHQVATRLEIWNIVGEKLITVSLQNAENEVNIQQLKAGMYLLRLQQGNQVSVKKLVKQ